VHFEDRPKIVEQMAAALSNRTEHAMQFRVPSPVRPMVRFFESGFKVHTRIDGIPGRITGVCRELPQQFVEMMGAVKLECKALLEKALPSGSAPGSKSK
jgi:hypothetical protein